MFEQRTILKLDANNASTFDSKWVTLDAKQRSNEVDDFEAALLKKVVAQDEAVHALSQVYQVYLSRMNIQNKPLGTLLFLGPTGSGKTRAVEAAAEVLFGDARAMVKIDCAEYQHSHEISKLIGSPPGYLGHRETPPLLTQDNLNRHHTASTKLTLVLFDEIEKASDALWHLLLGVLDKATLTLGDNRSVDFSNCIVILTSNLGAREMSDVTEQKLGFASCHFNLDKLDTHLERIGVESARRKFSPEFMNRLDKIVVFRSLTKEAVYKILDVELNILQTRILASGQGPFILRCADSAKDFLLMEGYDHRYGARPLKRAIERNVILPLANLIATGQIAAGDIIMLEVDEGGSDLVFRKLYNSIPATPTVPSVDSYRWRVAPTYF